MSEYIIEMKNITKKFPGIVANDNVTIQIKKGEIYALLGENGAGKSTLMSMLFGMYEPDEGEIYVRGKKEVIASPNYATQLNIFVLSLRLVKTQALLAISQDDVNCVATEAGLRFSVRGFGYALFYFQTNLVFQ